MATYLNRSISTSTDNNKFTISVWIKKTEIVSSDFIAILTSQLSGASTTGIGLWFKNDSIAFLNEISSTNYNENVTSAVYRDTNGWYHIVVNGDTSQSGSDKLKFYVNGEQITSFSTDNRSTFVGISNSLGNTTYDNYIGRKYDGNYQFSGLMTHFHFIDGTAYDADTFGQTDSASGIWKPKISPSVTYGTNGFFLDFANSSDLGNDVSGNDNDFTMSGSGTQTLDTPSNVFATMNPLDNLYAGSTFSNGNTTIATGTSEYSSNTGTLGVSSGKYYWEVEYDSGTNLAHIGIKSKQDTANSQGTGTQSTDYAYRAFNGDYFNNATSTSYGNTYTNGDIIGVALDLDNNKLYFAKNGTWQNQ